MGQISGFSPGDTSNLTDKNNKVSLGQISVLKDEIRIISDDQTFQETIPLPTTFEVVNTYHRVFLGIYTGSSLTIKLILSDYNI